MMHRARFRIDKQDDDKIILQDMGPWDERPTITNDAEAVIESLERMGVIRGRRVFYYDSDGRLDELVIEDGKFAGFRPGPR